MQEAEKVQGKIYADSSGESLWQCGCLAVKMMKLVLAMLCVPSA